MSLSKKATKIRDHWIWGKHPVIAALNNSRRVLKELVVTKQTFADLGDEIDFDNLGIPIKILERGEIDKILTGNNIMHQGIALKALPIEQPEFKEFVDKLSNKSTIVVLDKINDPHNLGAILRSSAAFNVDAVVIPKDNAASETSVVVKSSCGGIEIVPLISVTNISEALRFLKERGYWVAGLDTAGTSLFHEIKSVEKMVLVFGSEGEGIRKLTRENCDFIISIPISNRIESLNISNAVAISLYEIIKR